MTKPGGKVLKVPLGAGQWRAVKEMLKRNARYQSPNQSAKSILLELADISSENPQFGPILAQLGPCGPILAQLGPCGPIQAQSGPCGPIQAQSGPVGPSPSLPPRAPASDSGEEKRSEEALPPKPPVKSAAKKRAPAAALVDQEIASGIVAHLNAKAGTNYRPTGQSARQLISARLGEGYTVEDIKAVIEKKAAEWRGDPKMEKFLRPGTLFGREKFEQYHGQKAGAQAALDLGTEAGKRASWERAGVKQTYKPRPTPEEWLAAKEKDDD